MGFIYTPREEIEEGVLAAQLRGEAEDAYQETLIEWRLRMMREIAEGFASLDTQPF